MRQNKTRQLRNLLAVSALTGVLSYTPFPALTASAADSNVPAATTFVVSPDDVIAYYQKRQQNQQNVAKEISAYTNLPNRVVLTFGGLSDRAAVQSVVDTLTQNRMQATFFVTDADLEGNADLIRYIVSRHQDLGIGLNMGNDNDYYRTAAQIERIATRLKREYGVSPTAVRQIYGRTSSEVDEAVNAMGMQLIGQSWYEGQTNPSTSLLDEIDNMMTAAPGLWAQGGILYVQLDRRNDAAALLQSLRRFVKSDANGLVFTPKGTFSSVRFVSVSDAEGTDAHPVYAGTRTKPLPAAEIQPVQTRPVEMTPTPVAQIPQRTQTTVPSSNPTSSQASASDVLSEAAKPFPSDHRPSMSIPAQTVPVYTPRDNTSNQPVRTVPAHDVPGYTPAPQNEPAPTVSKPAETVPARDIPDYKPVQTAPASSVPDYKPVKMTPIAEDSAPKQTVPASSVPSYEPSGQTTTTSRQNNTSASTSTTVKKPAVTKGPRISAADQARYESLRQANQGQQAPKERFITTTAQNIIVTFGGLTKKAPVEDILNRLDAYRTKATFFVTELELQRYGSTVREIVNRGHELGLGLRTGENGTYLDTCAQIDRLQKRMLKDYGVKPVIARQVFGKETPEVNEACSAMGIRLFGQTINAVQTKNKEAVNAEDIFSGMFGKSIRSMGRGQIIYMRLDFLTHPMLTGQVLDLIKRNKIDNNAYRTFGDSPELNVANDSAYHLASIGQVLADPSKLWTYPVSTDVLPYSLRPGIVTVNDADKNLDRDMKKYYIGSPLVNDLDRVKGFNNAQRRQLDQEGVIKTVADNTIFFTFDDWSTDYSLNHLLYVLRKHHVPGNFFIITWNVKNNPNLLRAIAEDGHVIGSHTNRHSPMVDQGGYMKSMDKEDYAADVKQSYEELAKTIGDVTYQGQPVLTRYMRPPTLAISKQGIKSIFDAGFTYIVSGSESVDDYNAGSMQAVVGAIQHGIYDAKGNVRRGSILVMHMTDAAKYTAEALDIILTENEKRADDDPKKFKVGRLSDYLIDGYDQSIEQVPPLVKPRS